MSFHKRIHSLLAVVAAIALAVLATQGCGDDSSSELPFSPSDCETNEPNVGPLEVLLTIDAEFPSVPIVIYEGNIEDNDIITVDTLTYSSTMYDLFIDTQYSATARYVIGADTVLVIDSDRITKSRTDYRDRDCWDVQKGVVDLRLRIRP